MKTCATIEMRLVFVCVVASLVTAALAQNDPTFDAQVESYIWAMIPQPDGKVLVGGDLLSLDGVTRDRLGRVNSDGSLDTGFNPGTNGLIHSAAWLTNGQILVGGSFTTVGGQSHSRLARLNANGTVDATFTAGTDGDVMAMAVQSDGKIVVGGFFTMLAGQPRNCLGRLNADGSLDATFDPAAGGLVNTVAMQPDGRILVGGGFQSFAGKAVNFFCRLNPNGTLDTNFVASPNSHVHALAVQPDGKILAGGLFWTMNGQTRDSLARLNADGTLETNFTASISPGYQADVVTLAIQCDGKIVVGGNMSGWFAFPYFGRFNGNGTVDSNFVVNVPSGVQSVALQRDGKILRAAYSSLARMTNSPATESLIYSNSTITWLRGGGGPEVWRTTFESSTNLTTWTSLGAGTRIAGGWQRTGVSAPANAYIRARGFVAGGFLTASSWFVEAYAGRPVIVSQPASRTNNAGTTATFNVVADGTPSLTYRWRKNGTNLTNTGKVSGAANATLTVTNVLKADVAAYAVVVSNNFGAITSAVANLTVIDPFIVTQPADQQVNAGDDAHFNITAAGSAALKFQWLRNGLTLAGQTNAALTLTNVQGADAGSAFRVVVTNSGGALTSAVALLTVNVATADSLNPAPNYPVRSLAIQPDGKILLGGYFSWVGDYLRVGISRLNADGSMDTNFAAGISGIPFSVALPLVAVQEDGKILLAGGIGWANDVPRNQIARFLPDGTLDLAFNPDANADIYAMTLQADGKIVFGGSFTNLGGAACNHLGRLNSDGTRDTNFVSGANGTVYSLAVQPDGKLLIGGSFVALGDAAIARTNIGRLNSDGTVDAGFNPAADGTVNALTLQSDGAILVGGNFSILGGQARTNLGRLSSSGALDVAFNPGANGAVASIVVQTDGKIAVGGNFTTLAGQPRNYLGRLNTNGTPDMTFRPEADAAVNALALQPDGKLVVGGDFTMLDGQPRSHLGRLNSTTSAAQSLAYNLGTITWLRSGAGPEVSRVFFDASTNGTSLFRLSGTRVAGGWQATGPSLSANATVRARGWIAGSGDGSSWFAESALGPALIERQPASRTNDAQTLATLDILATGQQPLSFCWLKNGAPLRDGTNLVGSLTSTLRLNSVLGSEAGAYRCVVSNAFGSVTSVVATLTVRDPLFTGDPMGQALNAGDLAQFFVSAIGSTPLDYYWLKNGVPLADGGNISGAHSTMLTVANVLGGDAGAYRAVATNVWGSATSAVATLTVVDPLLTANPVNQSAHRGQTTTFSVSVTGTQPLAYQWRHDGALLVGATASSLVLTNVQATNAGGYDVVATNSFGSVTSAVATLAVNVAIPDTLNPGANAEVYAVALQPDGKVLLGGSFTSVAGQTRSRIARLNADGTLDTGFNPGASGSVWSFGVQPDGRILVGGSFTSLAGQSLTNLGRLNPDGSPDAAFSPNPTYNPIANSRVFALLPHSDGSILIGGVFSQVNGMPRPGIARLNGDGSLDTNFTASVDGFVCALAEQLDGRILVGGTFNTLNGEARSGLGRLHLDGTVDSSFTNVASSYIYALAEQPDGKILVGGWFSSLVGQTRSSLGRLNNDGSLDGSFDPFPDNAVYSIRLHADGWLIAGGGFGSVGGQPRARLAKISADGLLDAGFNPSANGTVFSIAGQPDGALVAGGAFTSIAGQARARIARLIDTAPATESLSSDASSITWLRGGAAPEVARTTFETTTNGTTWTKLGSGVRIPGGWRLGGLSLPLNATLRARGFTTSGGFQSSSSWFVESLVGTPLLSSQPVSRTNNATTTASFTVMGVNGLPTAYQWFKNGTNLVDGGNLFGATTATLTLSNVFGVDAGGYSVILSNASGTVTSAVAILTVIDPLITGQPAGQSVSAGQSATFTVTALASLPLSYQWRREGTTLGGATNSALGLTNAQRADAGNYTVVLSNQFGAVTSSPAPLAVNLALADAFNPGSGGAITQILPQPDGKIVAAGLFGSQNNPKYLARFNPDGSRDPGFIYTNVVVDVSSTYCLALQTDGRILGSGFGRQQLPTTLWRLNRDGTVDASFTNQISGSILGLTLLPDGRAWVGGSFTYNKPATLTNLALVQASGPVDTNFAASINGQITGLALQPDGQLLAGGAFTLINGQTATRLVRFTAGGVVDTNFLASANSTVNCLLVRPDGKILIAGAFTTLDGQTVNRIGRLNPDGSLDAAFNPNANGNVNSLALQADGKIVIGGVFTLVSGQPRNRLARLNPDGSLDPLFNPNANGTVYALGLQADGALVVAGSFSLINGQPRTNLARLVATDPAVQVLTYNAATLDWARSGACPEVWRTTFEMSTNGADWLPLGTGTRVAGGWRLSGVTLPPGAYARGRGFLTAGQNNAASWFVESGFGPPLITAQPVSRTNIVATVATFSVTAEGTAPLGYQWRKGDVPLADGGNIYGARTSMLTLSNVFGGDAGLFSVVISNVSGVVTSGVANLFVVEPIITAQPVAVTTNAGESISFSITAIGTLPTYQWRRDGTNLPGATDSSLILTNLQAKDVGSYTAVVSSQYGSATSAVATLNVNLVMPDSFGASPNDQVRALAMQTDKKLLLGGNFYKVGDQERLIIARLETDGTLDTAFPASASSSVNCITVQADGKMLVGGWFSTLNGQSRRSIGRLNSDGSLDGSFNPGTSMISPTPIVNNLVVQPDGKIIVGGWFTGLAGQTRNNIGRLNADGSIDATFNPNANNQVIAVALQPDGKTLLGGWFTSVGGQTHTRIARVNSDGTLDTNFNAAANSDVQSLAVQPDAKILVGGAFTALNGVTRNYLGRLNPDGTLDISFNPNPNGGVISIALQADGKIIISAGIGTGSSQTRFGITRLNPNGSLDPTFFPVIGGGVSSVAIQQDGALVLGGVFSSVAGQLRTNLARLMPTEPAIQILSCDGTTINWLRGGTSPEILYATFDLSADGTNWTAAGLGTRTATGWKLDGLSVPVNAFIRARGLASGGYWTGSRWFVENILQTSPLTPPTILGTDGGFGYHSNQFEFAVRALPGQAIVIEASTDFVQWIPVQTNLVTSIAKIIFSDLQAGIFQHRFYRARVYEGNLPPPAIVAGGTSFGFSMNGFGFDITGIAGQTVIIEASTNLLDWTALTTNVLELTLFQFSDSGSTNYASRFYRARLR